MDQSSRVEMKLRDTWCERFNGIELHAQIERRRRRDIVVVAVVVVVARPSGLCGLIGEAAGEERLIREGRIRVQTNV